MSSTPADYLLIYQRLLVHYGPQGWWPGETPFEVMVGAILTQNTAWQNVARAIARLQAVGCLDAKPILACPHEDLAELIRPAGYFNVKARRLQAYCAWYQDQGGFDALQVWPTATLRQALLAVHGIGPETADDILLYAFARPIFVIDAYTKRLGARLGLCAAKVKYETLQADIVRQLPLDVALFNEYHALIVRHSKAVCRAKPLCTDCCLWACCPHGCRSGLHYGLY